MFYYFSVFLVVQCPELNVFFQLGLCQSYLKSPLYSFPLLLSLWPDTPYVGSPDLQYACFQATPDKFILSAGLSLFFVNYFAIYMSI